MIKNNKFFVYSVGATIGRPPKLWLNNGFDICFLYGKSLFNSKTNGRIFFRLQAAVCRSPLQNEYAFQINESQK